MLTKWTYLERKWFCWPRKCMSEEAWMRLRSASSVLRVSRRRASMLRWLKCDRSSWASSSITSIMCRFLFFLIWGEEGPVLRLAVLRERAPMSDLLSSSVGEKVNIRGLIKIKHFCFAHYILYTLHLEYTVSPVLSFILWIFPIDSVQFYSTWCVSSLFGTIYQMHILYTTWANRSPTLCTLSALFCPHTLYVICAIWSTIFCPSSVRFCPPFFVWMQ